MTLGNNRAIKVGQWYANEIAASVDLNFIGSSAYENFVDQVALAYTQGINSGRNLVVGGLNLVWSNLLTVDFKAGAAISPKGGYLSGAIWGFVANEGESFLAIVSEDQSFAFDSGGANDRIDTVEIRPIETDYNALPRKFKDPVTQDITESLTNTRREYDYDVAIRKGDDASALAVEQSDFTFLDDSAAFGGNYLTFETAFGSYYIWWDEDDGDVDPAPTGRIGIEIDLEAAVHTTATLVATKTETDVLAAIAAGTLRGADVSRVTVVLSIDTTTYGDFTDATIGTVDISDLTVAVTDGNGAALETEGWIKLAEVTVANGVSAIDQDDIVGFEDSHLWNTEAIGTISARVSHGSDLIWRNGRPYQIDETTLFGGKYYLSMSDDNLGNEPDQGLPWKLSTYVHVVPGLDLTFLTLDTVPKVTAGSRIEANGIMHTVATIQTPTGSAVDGAYLFFDSSTLSFLWSITAGTYDKNGLYNVSDQRQCRFRLKSATTWDMLLLPEADALRIEGTVTDFEATGNVIVGGTIEVGGDSIIDGTLQFDSRTLESAATNLAMLSDPTEDNVFELLSPLVPLVGDIMAVDIHATSDQDAGANVTLSVFHALAVKRESTAQIRFYCLYWQVVETDFSYARNAFDFQANFAADDNDSTLWPWGGGNGTFAIFKW